MCVLGSEGMWECGYGRDYTVQKREDEYAPKTTSRPSYISFLSFRTDNALTCFFKSLRCPVRIRKHSIFILVALLSLSKSHTLLLPVIYAQQPLLSAKPCLIAHPALFVFLYVISSSPSSATRFILDSPRSARITPTPPVLC